MMKRLRELGFKGRFQILVEPESTKRLHYLIRGFRPKGPAVQRFPGRGDTVYVTENLHETAEKLGPVTLAVTGATDDSSLHAEQLNADALLVGQPNGWDRAARLSFRSGGMIMLGTSPGYANSIPAPEDIQAFLHTELGHDPDLRSKIPLLVDILAHSERQELVPMYGVGYAHSGPRQVVEMARALADAHAALPDKFADDLIIPVLSNLASEVAQFDELLAPLKGQGTIDVEVLRPDGPGLSVARSGRPRVVIALVGGVTQDVFDYLFSVATLSGTVAGRNGIDFASAVGHPFLAVAGDLHTVRGIPQHVYELARDAGQAIQNAASDERYAERHAALVSFLIAQRTDPEIAEAYEHLAQARAAQEDIVEKGLRALIEDE
jgi:hypothetical protein